MSDSHPTGDPRHTPLCDVHQRLGAKMVPFGGWLMPIEYTGILAEHRAVRQRAGLFDVSHMGEIAVDGPHALALIQHVTCNDASRLAPGQAQYSGLMTPEGAFVDDLLVYKFADQRYWLVVNAANRAKDWEHLLRHNDAGAQLTDIGDRYAQLALQGPLALGILQPLASVPLAPIRYYWFLEGRILDVPCVISRTGYTGEDGFELYFAPEYAERLWNALLAAGAASGLIPCGLGARNTLRLEAAMPLYGHEIDDTTSPLEAGLAWITRLNKPGFLGREPLLRQAATGPHRTLVGFEMIEPAIARDGYPVLYDGLTVGHVTSGGPSPTLGKNIAMAYVPTPLAQPGAEFLIRVRNRDCRARLVPLPFYRRTRQGT